MDDRIIRLLEKANAMEGIDTALIDALDAQKDKATTRYASYRRLNQFIRGVESVNKPSASEDDYEVDDATNNLTFVGDPDTVVVDGGDPDTVVVVGGEITGTNGKFKPLKPLKPVSPLNPYLPPGVKVNPNPSKNPGRLKPATEPTKVKPEVKVEVKPEVKVEVKPEVKTVSPVVKSEPPEVKSVHPVVKSEPPTVKTVVKSKPPVVKTSTVDIPDEYYLRIRMFGDKFRGEQDGYTKDFDTPDECAQYHWSHRVKDTNG